MQTHFCLSRISRESTLPSQSLSRDHKQSPSCADISSFLSSPALQIRIGIQQERTFLMSWLHRSETISAFSLPAKAMSDLTRKKQELDKEVHRISKELKRLGCQRRSGGKVHVCTGQRNTAQALMVMREGEPTAAMAFLKSKCKSGNRDATGWMKLETDLRAW